MKKHILCGILSTAFLLGTCSQALAASSDVATSDSSNPGASTAAVQPPEQTVRKMGLLGVERTVLEKNPTIRSLQMTVGSISSSKVGSGFQAQTGQIQAQIQAYQGLVQGLDDALQQLGSTDVTLKQTYETQKNILQNNVVSLQGALLSLPAQQMMTQAQIDDAYTTVAKQAENATNQICMGAQSILVTLQSLDLSAEKLNRSLAAIDRQLLVLDTQLNRGMVSQLQVDTVRRQRENLATSLQTLNNQYQSLGSSLALMCGFSADTVVQPSALTPISAKELRDMKYESDLEEALKNSFSIWSKQVDARKASNQVNDSRQSTIDAFDAAKTQVEAERENVQTRFRAIYDAVGNKKSLLDAAEITIQKAEKDFEVKKVQYGRGAISQLEYQQAEDTLNDAKLTVETAKIDLISAYNQYKWAKCGLISAAS